MWIDTGSIDLEWIGNRLDKLRRKFGPPHEVSPEDYLSSHLTVSDADALETFLDAYSEAQEIPSAILAVGSSTYTQEELANRRKETYNDIDLRIVPMRSTSTEDLADSVHRTLDSLYYPHRDVYKYESLSVVSRLSNKTDVELIIGKKGLLLEDASDKIASERRNNEHFSLLYLP